MTFHSTTTSAKSEVVIPVRVRRRILAEIAAELRRQPMSILHEGTPFPRLMAAGDWDAALRHLPASMWGWLE